uniref:Uncharacterized protein n=1 Tax=Mycena chlorophos TaxID=658473 RepID=A0ABQ0LKH2_MYCCL|nr:predicted protein [Mycena chlorophos]
MSQAALEGAKSARFILRAAIAGERLTALVATATGRWKPNEGWRQVTTRPGSNYPWSIHQQQSSGTRGSDIFELRLVGNGQDGGVWDAAGMPSKLFQRDQSRAALHVVVIIRRILELTPPQPHPGVSATTVDTARPAANRPLP